MPPGPPKKQTERTSPAAHGRQSLHESAFISISGEPTLPAYIPRAQQLLRQPSALLERKPVKSDEAILQWFAEAGKYLRHGSLLALAGNGVLWPAATVRSCSAFIPMRCCKNLQCTGLFANANPILVSWGMERLIERQGVQP